ncbi:hypothetical protein PpBr36_02124 [Pyricularia pennisetigena]|uniref:hypothetical protein n=1 Tax=Pyricularia pennisetigena TaxID=1578925 RepID=UPI001153ED99|nr:hypothetical protein PpBr36_02124 [Pyricularia pennisetigena]TLS28396.1 hypothetical protein PpBr36_02124 [Pyricularia pennisetigena]
MDQTKKKKSTHRGKYGIQPSITNLHCTGTGIYRPNQILPKPGTVPRPTLGPISSRAPGSLTGRGTSAVNVASPRTTKNICKFYRAIITPAFPHWLRLQQLHPFLTTTTDPTFPSPKKKILATPGAIRQMRGSSLNSSPFAYSYCVNDPQPLTIERETPLIAMPRPTWILYG